MTDVRVLLRNEACPQIVWSAHFRQLLLKKKKISVNNEKGIPIFPDYKLFLLLKCLYKCELSITQYRQAGAWSICTFYVCEGRKELGAERNFSLNHSLEFCWKCKSRCRGKTEEGSALNSQIPAFPINRTVFKVMWKIKSLWGIESRVFPRVLSMCLCSTSLVSHCPSCAGSRLALQQEPRCLLQPLSFGDW